MYSLRIVWHEAGCIVLRVALLFAAGIGVVLVAVQPVIGVLVFAAALIGLAASSTHKEEPPIETPAQPVRQTDGQGQGLKLFALLAGMFGGALLLSPSLRIGGLVILIVAAMVYAHQSNVERQAIEERRHREMMEAIAKRDKV
jgi:hypothetical protein